MEVFKQVKLTKVLIKNAEGVHHKVYDKYALEFDPYHYYVYYSSKPDENGLYSVYTNSNNFGETSTILQTEHKEEAVKIAESINKAFRLMAGYFDEVKPAQE